MSKIRIKNFGPIKEGCLDDNGWININKVTLLIGNQASGKSTVAKLISTMTWIEKALVRGDFKEKDLTNNSFKNHCSYQNIASYFKDNSLIEYEGAAFRIYYKDSNVSVKKNTENDYSFPKIMYVPSERNLLSSVRNVENLKGLPSTLYTLSKEFIKASEELKGQIILPINNIKLEYQKLNKLSYIIGEDYKIKLSESSSGIQSFVPLFIVSAYLGNSLKKKENNVFKEISIEEEKRIRGEVEGILSNPNINDEIKKAALEFLSSKTSYSAFINIVEEPEQNLFPTSQKKMLYNLLEVNNSSKGNKLIMTTHSPYLINYLTLAIEANNLKLRISELTNEQKNKLQKILPFNAILKPDELSIYELFEEEGLIKLLDNYKGLPSDENKLNEELGEGNELFAKLLEIEQRL